MSQTLREKIIKEQQAQQEKSCNHFMVWNCQGGYAYFLCDKCNYIDGKKTFAGVRQQVINEILPHCCRACRARIREKKGRNLTQ